MSSESGSPRVTHALAGVRQLPAAELRALFRLNPARAHRRFREFRDESRRAKCADHAAIKQAARDKEDQRRLEDEYREAVLAEHDRALAKLRDVYAACLESASRSQFDRAQAESRRGDSWQTMMSIGSHAAGVLAADRAVRAVSLHRRIPAARPAARRPGTRRTSRTSRGSPSGDDSGGPEPSPEPWRRGELRPLSLALEAALEQLRPAEMGGRP